MAKSGAKKSNAGGGDRLPFFSRPQVGTTLTVLSGLGFLQVCLLLPMVGQAGATTEFAGANRVSFATFASLSLLLSLLAIWSKLSRRHVDHSPLPIGSMMLSGMATILLVSLFAGWLSV